MIQLHQNHNTNLSPFLVFSMTVPTIDYHYTADTIYTELLYDISSYFPPSDRVPNWYHVYELESIHIEDHALTNID